MLPVRRCADGSYVLFHTCCRSEEHANERHAYVRKTGWGLIFLVFLSEKSLPGENLKETIIAFIEKIEQINLKAIGAYEKVIFEFNNLLFIPHFTMPFFKGSKIYRCRLNRSAILFSQVNELSYTPKSLVKDYGRCNSPGKSVFYCTEYGLYSLIELLHLLNGGSSIGDVPSVTINEWELVEDLCMAVVFNPTDGIQMERYKQNFQNDFNQIIDQQIEGLRCGSIV